MNDLRGAIIGGLTGTAMAGPVGAVISVVVGGVTGSCHWRVQFAIEMAVVRYALIED